MIFGLELIIFLGILFVWWYKKKVWLYPANFPPGPRFPLPVVGDAIALGQDVAVGLVKLHKKHGNVVGFMLGGYPAISIGDFETLQKTYGTDEYSNRTPAPGFEIFRRDDGVKNDENTSLSLGHGQQWNIMHNFAVRYKSLARSTSLLSNCIYI